MEKDIDREKFKEKKRAELEALYDAVNEEMLMIADDPEKFSAYLRVQARFNRYTVTNAILLLHQFPDAQKLKTFEGWKQDGASVKRGEKSISILEPYSYTKADGSMGKGFRIKKLFDISQTDVRMSPDPFLTGVSIRSLLRALLEASSVETEAADTLDHGKDAVYEQKKQKIYIRRMLEPDDFFRAAAVSLFMKLLSIKDYILLANLLRSITLMIQKGIFSPNGTMLLRSSMYPVRYAEAKNKIHWSIFSIVGRMIQFPLLHLPHMENLNLSYQQ